MQAYWIVPLLVVLTLAPLVSASPPTPGNVTACGGQLAGDEGGLLWVCVAGQRNYLGCPLVTTVCQIIP
jgi:hypothetical protein